jgi:hypothetical protein
MSGPQNPYGFKYFDRMNEYEDEEESDEDYEAKSCPGNCCDQDCECDDCERCSLHGNEEESYSGAAG